MLHTQPLQVTVRSLHRSMTILLPFIHALTVLELKGLLCERGHFHSCKGIRGYFSQPPSCWSSLSHSILYQDIPNACEWIFSGCKSLQRKRIMGNSFCEDSLTQGTKDPSCCTHTYKYLKRFIFLMVLSRSGPACTELYTSETQNTPSADNSIAGHSLTILRPASTCQIRISQWQQWRKMR